MDQQTLRLRQLTLFHFDDGCAAVRDCDDSYLPVPPRLRGPAPTTAARGTRAARVEAGTPIDLDESRGWIRAALGMANRRN